ncbi:MAG: hypothetical protein R3Y47_01210 [Lachnospiraceae bacterium]
MDKVSLQTLKALEKDIDEIIEANGKISEEEKCAKDQFMHYLHERESREDEICTSSFSTVSGPETKEIYYDKILSENKVDKSTQEYRENMEGV